MKLVFAKEMQSLDQQSAEQIGLPTMVLMENAGKAVAETAADFLEDCFGKNIVVFTGKGNNGGDGFAAARWLSNQGARVKVFLVSPWQELTGDAAAQLRICRKCGIELFALKEDRGSWDVAEVSCRQADLVIDAVLGTGFNGVLQGVQQRVCGLMNSIAVPVVSIDVPSGVSADTGSADKNAVQADITVTMALAKPGLFLYPAAELSGEIIVADIGMPKILLERMDSKKFLLTENIACDLLPQRNGNCHKGEAGRVVITAGSPGFTGAAALCSEAAVKAGAGLVSLLTPLCSREVLAVKLTEIMVEGLIERMPGALGGGATGAVLDKAGRADVLAIGPGLGTSGSTVEVIREILQSVEVPVIIDADALTALQGHVGILNTMRAPKVLTPHPGELGRLLDLEAAEVDARRLELAGNYAAEWDAVLVLKGAPTVIGCPDGNVYINTTGNSAMATGGSGDVLTGIIAGLAAQGISVQEAALAGVYMHGLAGDLASKGIIGMAAGEISQYLPHARRIIEQGE